MFWRYLLRRSASWPCLKTWHHSDLQNSTEWIALRMQTKPVHKPEINTKKKKGGLLKKLTTLTDCGFRSTVFSLFEAEKQERQWKVVPKGSWSWRRPKKLCVDTVAWDIREIDPKERGWKDTLENQSQTSSTSGTSTFKVKEGFLEDFCLLPTNPFTVMS